MHQDFLLKPIGLDLDRKKMINRNTEIDMRTSR